MRSSRFLYRILLAAFIWCLPVYASGIADTLPEADHSNYGLPDRSEASVHLPGAEQKELLPDRVHSSISGAAAPCAKSGRTGSGGPFGHPRSLWGNSYVLPLPPIRGNPAAMQRWLILSRELMCERLSAIYPQHGFW